MQVAFEFFWIKINIKKIMDTRFFNTAQEGEV